MSKANNKQKKGFYVIYINNKLLKIKRIVFKNGNKIRKAKKEDK